MKTKNVNCVIVGLGKVGLTQHIPAMLQVNKFKLSGCVTRSKERYLQAKKSFPDVIWYKNLDELLKDKLPKNGIANLAIICTPSDLHYKQSILLLKKGYDLLIEKPVTLNAKEAILIKNLAKKLNRRIFAFHNRHYDADISSILKIVSSGKLGNIFHIEIHMFSSFGPGWGNYGVTNWRIKGKAGGMLYDWGSHMFEQILQIFPEGIETVYAKLKKQGNFKLVDDHDFIHLTSKNKNDAFIFISNLCPAKFPHWLLIGEKGTLRSEDVDYWNWYNFAMYQYQNNKIKIKKFSPSKIKFNIDVQFYNDLYKEICGKKGSLKVTFDDAIKVMKIIDAAFISNKINKPVKIKI